MGRTLRPVLPSLPEVPAGIPPEWLPAVICPLKHPGVAPFPSLPRGLPSPPGASCRPRKDGVRAGTSLSQGHPPGGRGGGTPAQVKVHHWCVKEQRAGCSIPALSTPLLCFPPKLSWKTKARPRGQTFSSKLRLKKATKSSTGALSVQESKQRETRSQLMSTSI